MREENTVGVAATASKLLTCDAFFAMFPEEDEGVRRELIDGEVFVTPNPVLRHQQLVQRLGLTIAEHLESHPSQGEVFMVSLDVVMSRFDVVVPDIQVILGSQTEIMTEKNIQGTPALVVEVLSPSTRRRDLTKKYRLYEREGVREYWVVDPKKNKVTVHHRTDRGTFADPVVLGAARGDMLDTPLLPGWHVELAHLFR